MNLSLANSKATLAALCFGACGALSAIFWTTDWHAALLPLVFYAILVLNTFFSVRVFSAIIPKDNIVQNVIDIGIVVPLYFILAFQFQNPLGFVATATALFAILVIKYSLLLNILPTHRRLLRKKIFVNTLGLLLLGASSLMVALGHTLFTPFFYTIIFALANIYLLTINPLYRLDNAVLDNARARQ